MRLAPVLRLLLLLSFQPYSGRCQVLDNRCFLENGGSAESFFVSEDVAVGSIIGILRVFGDPNERHGDISLRLKERDSPVILSSGTKNLTLVRPLDKEGVSGPSSVYVNVICDRKRTVDPFIIPVNIRVTDANDNAPKFENAPYMINISEVTVVGSRVLQGVRAVDADQQGPYSTVHYSVLPGPNAEYFKFPNELDGTLQLMKPLDYETLPNFTVAIRAQDEGSPAQYSDTLLYVFVIDADDQNPSFEENRYSALLQDPPKEGSRLKISPRPLRAFDQDRGINAPIVYSINSVLNEQRLFVIDSESAIITLRRSVRDDELNEPITLVIKASQKDNPDRYALVTLLVTRRSSTLADLRFLQERYQAAIPENVPANSTLLSVVTNRHHDKRLRFSLDGADTFSISPVGDIQLVKNLDYETRTRYSLKAQVTDGLQNVTALVDISVLNVNEWDPRFRYPQYEFFVPMDEMRHGGSVGRVEAADGDRGDRVTLELRGSFARLFSISDSGLITLVSPQKLNSTIAHLVAVATDSGVPPRQASVPVIVHIPEAVAINQGELEDVNGGLVPGARGFSLLLGFGSMLALLAGVIFVLILYIYKHKKKKNRVSEPIPSHDLEKNPEVENPVFSEMEKRRSGTATVKSIMSSRQNSLKNSHIVVGNTSLGDAPCGPRSTEKSLGGHLSLSEPLGKLQWPAGSIPRRVKKLSWDDENQEKHELDPEVSVTPIAAHDEQMNLTVYF